MAFTTEELANIANASLDWFMSDGESPFYQTIQEKPLLAKMDGTNNTFPGGKGDISVAVKGDFGMPVDATGTPAPVGTSDALKGFTHDDSVEFYTPANQMRAGYPWREHHIGMSLTHTELKIDGISVVDTNGAETSKHSRREMTALQGLLEDKLFDLGEQYARGLNSLLWGDGTADAKALAGLMSVITANPTTGTVGGINRAIWTWWRNHAYTAAHGAAGGTGAITSSPNNGGVLAQALQKLHRQLRRYGGRPSLFLAGSDFIDALETEYRANGYYSDSGFTGSQDMGVGAIRFKGMTVTYDPTLDDMSMAKYGYIIDTNAIKLMKMEDEWRRQHTPARPAEKFVLYRSITSTGQLVANRCNSSAVVQIT